MLPVALPRERRTKGKQTGMVSLCPSRNGLCLVFSPLAVCIPIWKVSKSFYIRRVHPLA
jgi:hypothetical protein